MKKIVFAILPVLFLACQQQPNNLKHLQKQIDSLKVKLAQQYKPGFGEFMTGIQTHHAKLWFAGTNKNWKLANFEIHEIMELIDDIKNYETERKESAVIDMIKPALDSVNQAIQSKNIYLFKSSYINLTNTCNQCHKDVHFEFNVVKIPTIQGFSNQDFKSH